MLITQKMVTEFLRSKVSFERYFGKLGFDCHFRNHEEAAKFKQQIGCRMSSGQRGRKKKPKKSVRQRKIGKIKLRIRAATKAKYPGKAGYRLYLKSKWWKYKRRCKMAAVGYKCEECDSPAQEVHHLTYQSLGSEKNKDLQALCSKCHRLKHGIVVE